MRRITFLPVLLIVLPGAAAVTTSAATLTLSERIEAQRRVEQVYWAHRVWPTGNASPKPALSDVLDEAILAARAKEGLLKSEILADRFNKRIDSGMLWTEVQRMTRASRDTALLGELFAALDNDGAMIAEVLARPIVADRLLYAAYESSVAPDKTGRRPTSFSEWWDQQALAPPPTVASLGLDEASSDFGPAPAITASGCTDDTWTPFGLTSPSRREQAVIVWTGSEVLVWGGVGENAAGTILDSWRYKPSTDAWTAMATDPNPDTRAGGFTGVWTGSELIVYGSDANGRRYNPATNTWRSMAAGPIAYDNETAAVWTGPRMLLWDAAGVAGGLYDPATDSWTDMSTSGAPSSRFNTMTAWAGSRFIVWGGFSNDLWDTVNDGAVYDPATDTWAPTTLNNAPPPHEWMGSASTGTEMVVFGNDWGGARYNPTADTWTWLSTVNQPNPVRQRALMVYGAGKVLVWGGLNYYSGSAWGDGGSYDITTDTWTSITMTNAPAPRSTTTPVWTGTEMVIWGGAAPADNTLNAYLDLDDGARYNPATDQWKPISRQVRPLARTSSEGVWTGAEMLLWGGLDLFVSGQGWAYNAATDNWRTLPVSGAPDPRDYPTALWTGAEMLVWGGCCLPNTALPFDSGGRYNPTTNLWAPMSQDGAPGGRQGHVSAWTGSQMLVWGGVTAGGDTNTGARYTAANDKWTPMTTTGAPSARGAMVSVWTGSRLLVWGGYSYAGYSYHADGARYDPVADAWIPMSYGGASGRIGASAVWSGNEMLIFGGFFTNWAGYNWVTDDWRYNPATDTWHIMSNVNQPWPRTGHSAIWNGSKMIVWGGGQNGSSNDGGRYDPVADSWTPTRLDDTTPLGRSNHAAVWTGAEMLIWGGSSYDNGSRYCSGGCTPLTWYRDADGDGVGNASVTQSSCTQPTGYVGVAGDCDDTNSTIWGTPGEVINLNLVRTTGAAAMLTWAPPAFPGGTAAGTRYDTLRSTQASDFSATHATCVATGSSTLQTSDATKPAAGTSFYYLVRAMNNCSGGTGVGSLGSTSAGAPRPGRVCP